MTKLNQIFLEFDMVLQAGSHNCIVWIRVGIQPVYDERIKLAITIYLD